MVWGGILLEGQRTCFCLTMVIWRVQGTETRTLDLLLGPRVVQSVRAFSWYTTMHDLMWQNCASDFRGSGHWHNWLVSTLYRPSSTSGASWMNAFASFRTHTGQSKSSPMPWLNHGRISILEQPIDLSEECPGVVERAFKHVGVIPAITVSFQYDNRNFGANPYLDYHFVFPHDFGNFSSNGYSPFALANYAKIVFCSRYVKAFL